MLPSLFFPRSHQLLDPDLEGLLRPFFLSGLRDGERESDLARLSGLRDGERDGDREEDLLRRPGELRPRGGRRLPGNLVFKGGPRLGDLPPRHPPYLGDRGLRP